MELPNAFRPGASEAGKEYRAELRQAKQKQDMYFSETGKDKEQFLRFKANAAAEDEQRKAQLKSRAREIEAERAQAAAEAAHAARARKLVLCGDTKGCQSKLFETMKAQLTKVGKIDVLFAVGVFLSEKQAQEDPYMNGESTPPVETYFVDTDAALLRTAPGGTTLCKNLHFLGGYGVTEICGLRVAFLSGIYDAGAYNTCDADFVGSCFTIRAVQNLRKIVVEDPRKRGIDILLTCGWPAGLDAQIEDPDMQPVRFSDGSSWESACARPLAELCAQIEPRYHAFGTADLFYQRPPFKTVRGYPCRCIGLGTVGSTGKERKWLHALSISPMAHMTRDELNNAPPNMTPSPFYGLKRAAPSDPELPPAAKKIAQPVNESSDEDAP